MSLSVKRTEAKEKRYWEDEKHQILAVPEDRRDRHLKPDSNDATLSSETLWRFGLTDDRS